MNAGIDDPEFWAAVRRRSDRLARRLGMDADDAFSAANRGVWDAARSWRGPEVPFVRWAMAKVKYQVINDWRMAQPKGYRYRWDRGQQQAPFRRVSLAAPLARAGDRVLGDVLAAPGPPVGWEIDLLDALDVAARKIATRLLAPPPPPPRPRPPAPPDPRRVRAFRLIRSGVADPARIARAVNCTPAEATEFGRQLGGAP
jgi:hypothetical protein